MDFARPTALLHYILYVLVSTTVTLRKGAYSWKCTATLTPGFYVRSTGAVATLQVDMSYGGTFDT